MMNELWISILPALLIQKLGPLSLVLIGYLVEKNFVGRIASFSNALAINLHAFTISNPANWLVWYSNIGFLVGIIALFSYGLHQSLPKYFYILSWAYASFVVGFIILATSG